MINHYHIRITCMNTDSNRLAMQSFLQKYALKGYVMFEVSRQGIDHYHMYMTSTSVLHTVQGYVRLFFKQLNRRDKMVKLIEIDTLRFCQRYICKGRASMSQGKSDYDLVYAKAIQTQLLDELHEEFWDNNQPPTPTSISIEASSESVKPKKKTETFVEKCYKECVSKGIKFEKDIGQDIIFRHNVFKVVMRMLGKNAKGLDVFIVKRLLNGVMNMLNPTGMEHYMWGQLFPHESECMNGLECLF